MLTLEIRVPLDRDRAAIATLRDGSRPIHQDDAAASALPSLAAALRNPGCDPLRPGGHPPLGTYRFVLRQAAPAGTEGEYGPDLLLFRGERGPALEAEAYGRLALLAYSGAPGADGHLRRTQGGLRLSREMMRAVVDHVGHSERLGLRIEAIDPPSPWWRFWNRSQAVATRPLSTEPPHFVAPPVDEVSLLAHLLSRMPIGQARPASESRDDRDRWDRSSARSSDGPEPEPFRGGGGSFGGAGASSSWDGAGTAAGRGPGVDGAGRIAGAAAVAAAAAAAAVAAGALAADGEAAGNAEQGSGSADGDGAPAWSGGGAAGDGGSDSESAPGTATQTAY